MTYYEPLYRRVMYFVFGTFLTLGSIPLSLYLLAKRSDLNQGETVFLPMFVFVILCCGIGLMMTSIRYRLTLTPQSLTLRRAFTSETMARSDIAGYRSQQVNNAPTLVLYARRKKWPAMRFPCVFENGDAVMAWMDGIPDLNVEDQRRRSQRQ
jgi:hypothetical protein